MGPASSVAHAGAGIEAFVAGYEILSELGRGSMGVVYKARQKDLNRLVALKTIRAGTQGRQEGLSRFITEARALARLQHPNIIQIYEISLQQDLPFFAMELVEGGNLSEFLDGRPQPYRQAAELVLALARAMHAAHQQGIVHRDLKPANILLSDEGRGASGERSQPNAQRPTSLLDSPLATRHSPLIPKITDFGLAKCLEGESGQTQSGMVMGTPNYMAPEQAEGHSRDVGPAADIYALGAILYECLTGRPPYNAESPAETVLLLFRAEPLSPSRLQPKLPRDVETICLKCLQKDPQRRYESAEELADDLERFLKGEPIRARPTPLHEQAWKWLRRRPGQAALAGSSAVGIIVVLILLLWHQSELQARLFEARQEEQQARAQEELLKRQEELTRVRGEAVQLLQKAESALAAEDWELAEQALARGRDRTATVPELADLHEQLERLHQRSTQQREDRIRLRQFQERRSDALLNATLFTGSDLASALEQTRRAAREALATFGVTLADRGGPDLARAQLKEPEREQVVIGCYELLLVLAAAMAQPLPEESADQRKHRAREALQVLDRAEALGPRTRAVRLRRAQYLRQAGESEAAQKEENQARLLKPTGALDHFLLGEELQRQGNVVEASRSYERVLQEEPGHFWAQYYLALCRLKQREFALAVSGFTACLSRRADFPWLYLLRGGARSELKQFTAAEADFEAALKFTLDEPCRYALYNFRGVLRIHQGLLADAVNDLKRAVALRPKLYQGHVNLAQAHVQSGRLDEAVQEMSRAIACESRLAALYRTRAQIHQLLRDEGAALADLEQALRLGSEDTPLLRASDHLERARLLLRQGKFGPAEEAAAAALRLRPVARAHRLRAEALLGLQRHPEALAALDACLEVGPVEAEVLCARASVRSRLGQYAGAQADYSRALELKPDADTFSARGWIHLVAEAPRLALADFEAALRLEANRSDSLAGRGLARAMVGQPLRAIEDARQALRHGPPSSRLCYNTARIYSQAGLRLDQDSTLDRGLIPSLRADYFDRAIALLGEALEKLPPPERSRFWKEQIQKDPAFRPLQRVDGFHRLSDRWTRSSSSS